jgi:branched-chain amino acid transport system permease protein
MGCVFTLVALGITLIWGVMRLTNFAHGEFVMLAMYSSFWLSRLYGFDPYTILPLNAIIFFLVGFITYKLVIKKLINSSSEIQMFATFGLRAFIASLALALWTADPRIVENIPFNGVIVFYGIHIGIPEFISSIICIITLIMLYIFLNYSKIGKALRATSQDRDAAMAIGIDAEKMFALSWGIGIMFAGIAGSLLITYTYVYPYIGLIYMFCAFAAVTIGGLGSILGSLVGGVVIGIVENALGYLIDPGAKLVYVYIIFILFLLIYPRGLFGEK